MSTVDLSTDSKRRPADLVSDVALSEDAVALMPKAVNTYAYLSMLKEGELFNDAFLTLARVLPKQYAIIWAARCVEAVPEAELNEIDKRCLELSKKWLNGPNESVRRAAMDAANDRNYEGAFAWLAAAVGFSGGSLAPANQAEVPPPHHLTAVAVSACLTFVASREPESYPDSCRMMIDKGLAMVAIPGSAGAA